MEIGREVAISYTISEDVAAGPGGFALAIHRPQTGGIHPYRQRPQRTRGTLAARRTTALIAVTYRDKRQYCNQLKQLQNDTYGSARPGIAACEAQIKRFCTPGISRVLLGGGCLAQASSAFMRTNSRSAVRGRHLCRGVRRIAAVAGAAGSSPPYLCLLGPGRVRRRICGGVWSRRILGGSWRRAFRPQGNALRVRAGPGRWMRAPGGLAGWEAS